MQVSRANHTLNALSKRIVHGPSVATLSLSLWNSPGLFARSPQCVRRSGMGRPSPRSARSLTRWHCMARCILCGPSGQYIFLLWMLTTAAAAAATTTPSLSSCYDVRHSTVRSVVNLLAGSPAVHHVHVATTEHDPGRTNCHTVNEITVHNWSTNGCKWSIHGTLNQVANMDICKFSDFVVFRRMSGYLF